MQFKPMKVLTLNTILLFTIVHFALGQKTISGYVYSSVDSCKIPGTSVFYKGLCLARMTGADGSYQIEIYEGVSYIYFSQIGFKTMEVPINNVPDTVYLQPFKKRYILYKDANWFDHRFRRKRILHSDCSYRHPQADNLITTNYHKLQSYYKIQTP